MADENMVKFSVQPQENNKENEEDEMEVENEDDTVSEEGKKFTGKSYILQKFRVWSELLISKF